MNGANSPAPVAVVSLAEAAHLDAAAVGTKAATLARLRAAGFPVPAGFVVTTAAQADRDWEEGVLPHLDAATASLGGGGERQRFAVRSSAAAEDLEGASFAGQYETVLNVAAAALPTAIRQVLASAATARVSAYRQRQARAGADASSGLGSGPGMAVLVQAMVDAAAAGVAFTANPVTGERDEVVVTAIRGLGERLVGGEATGDEWVVRGTRATCRRAREGAIDAGQAAAIAALARRVQQHLGLPQDVEWAIEAGSGRLRLLQARPMTALPEPVRWAAPGPGYWMRNFRLGEWLPEPMTPLFQDWLLERLGDGVLRAQRRMTGTALPWQHAAINGWYYTTPGPQLSPGTLLHALREGRGKLVSFIINALIRVGTRPEAADRAVLGTLAEEWRRDLLPRYRSLVEQAEAELGTASPAALARLVEQVAEAAGEYLLSLEVVGGAAWKMEGCLAKFHRRHLASAVGGSVQVLLRGLPGMAPGLPAHAVQSIDWYHPTAGELGFSRSLGSDKQAHERSREIAAEREAMEAACRAALAGRPRLLARFDSLLGVAQRYAVIREEQARSLTLGWPLLRRCVLRLGESLAAAGAIETPEDAFFLTRAELTDQPPGQRSLQEPVSHRRVTWERQRRLVAPLTIGRLPRLIGDPIASMAAAVRTAPTAPIPEGAISGQPASPGRASGPVRVVRDSTDFDRFQPGEVLVAPATAPAWTPLFAKAVAVVTDGGNLAAHASLVAREYGIPAVVATGDATTRLHDGQLVTVDGSAGLVEPQ